MSQAQTGGQVYIEAFVQIPRELSDAVGNFIIENLATGLVIEDEEDASFAGIRFYIPQERRTICLDSLSTYLGQLDQFSPGSLPKITERVISPVSWEDAYRESVPLVHVEPDVVVRPPWLVSGGEGRFEIVIEPKMAFGTGRHETTISCLQSIRQHFRSGMRFLDIGCGSGILSILAAKMGASYIKAVDNDLVAIENARENFEINGVSCPFELSFGSIDRAENEPPFQFVIANIIKSTILDMLEPIVAVTARPGILVLSGLLEQEVSEINQALSSLSIFNHAVVPNNEWRTYVIRLS